MIQDGCSEIRSPGSNLYLIRRTESTDEQKQEKRRWLGEVQRNVTYLVENPFECGWCRRSCAGYAMWESSVSKLDCQLANEADG
jgi:hypothetical protein